MKFDLEHFSISELEELLATAEHRKKTLATRRPIAVVRAELIAMAQSWGYSIEELVTRQPSIDASETSPRRKQKRGKAPAKYRDPENKRNTWSGRGRMPLWLAHHVKRGRAAADYLIPGLARPTANKSAVGQRSVFKSK